MIWQVLKSGSIFTGILILGPILGFLLGIYWFEGGNTFWKPIDYFPLRVAKIIAMEEFGHEFCVETTDQALYHIIYPCQKGETCWGKISAVPDVSHNKYGEYVITQNKCEVKDFVYPLFREIKMCITSTALAPDAIWTVSLAVTETHKMWIWQKPWEDQFSILIFMILWILGGGYQDLLSEYWLPGKFHNWANHKTGNSAKPKGGERRHEFERMRFGLAEGASFSLLIPAYCSLHKYLPLRIRFAALLKPALINYRVKKQHPGLVNYAALCNDP